MRTEEERLELIRKRTKEIQKKNRQRRQRILDLGCVAACVIIIVSLGMLMPQLTGQMQYKQVDSTLSAAASMLGGNHEQGYIIMGISCFLLGVCVTILMYRMHNRNKGNDSDEF